MAKWIDACATDDIDEEDVIRFDHEGRTFAIYHSPDDAFFCTDGLCTHEKVHLSDGLVMEHRIECPKHSGVYLIALTGYGQASDREKALRVGFDEYLAKPVKIATLKRLLGG